MVTKEKGKNPQEGERQNQDQSFAGGKGVVRKKQSARAASILTAIYHMLKDGTEHHDLGAGLLRSPFDRNQKTSHLVARSTKIGQLYRPAPISSKGLMMP